ncbi:hypothetical protein BDV96DRAFT_653444 [Lophiotrema nucula]|uniref:Uncharacterized protein n=1 Tax=Lophiotrema nucula TaxID=690887 RepID=A0A6A5YKL8_9PLEO|nr:hypothetical protein BDV96DRAFT_653444 [Lophiotrema nucula]
MSNKNEQGGIDVTQKNVYDKPLLQHSNPKSMPSLGKDEKFFKAGFCNDQAPIAAIMTDGFLDFSATKGVDLRKHGLQSGQRLCVESTRWNEANEKPEVNLASTHHSALDNISLVDLKKYADTSDTGSDNKRVHDGGDSKSGPVRDSGSIGGKEPKA